MRTRLLAGLGLLVLTGCGGSVAGPDAAPSVASAPAAPDGGTAAGMADCTHPAGFRVSHPADWSVNAGDVLPVCSWFADEPFTVLPSSDVRTADITFSVRPREELPGRLPDETQRSAVEVDGRGALRLEQVATPGFYPGGTRITTYVVALPSGGDALWARTVGLPPSEHERNVAVLDAMMASLVLDAAPGV